ncbi:interleukin-20 receptor subunit beta isoform X2 [Nothobranchius furzeri]|uniref:Transcript variant X2 n=1 Tax=Nothobranchius furzeri TaxID=105023 RepID=A0A9D2YM06_NOTFU|nr:cytokine receptor family member B16 isoform X2 [Nothobranchius furzeri]KAF7221869.1 transcript variant X2 [Nothobranchius furzeri]
MIFIVMTLRNLLMPLILLDFMNDVWTLSPPSRVLMDSVNLRHILRWSSPTTSCNTTVLYSVRYQGEFELLFMNNSWLEAARCQKIPGSECDLSLDLGTDADYVLQVRAECGSQLSNWAKVPFNRRNTILQVPEMMVTTMDDALQVSIIKPSVSASVTVWEKDDEPQAVVYMMAAEQKDLHVAALQEGEEYCVKAQLVLNPGAHSGYTETRSRGSSVEGTDHRDSDHHYHAGSADRVVLVHHSLSSRILADVFPEGAAAAVAERKLGHSGVCWA